MALSLGVTTVFAQVGPRGGGAPGPNLGGAMNKLFGANQAFTATLEVQNSGDNGDVTIPGKISFDNGKSRFEMNMTEMRGAQMPPNAMQQMKAMGMDSIVTIARPDLKVTYLVYPGLNSYAQMAERDPSASVSPDDLKIETEKIAAETVDGHDCVKNKVTVTDKEGGKHVSTVWNAADLKGFPVKIVTSEGGNNATLLFKNISLTKPAAGSFEPPAGLTKYDDMQTMMQTEMMKKMGGGRGLPPGQQ